MNEDNQSLFSLWHHKHFGTKLKIVLFEYPLLKLYKLFVEITYFVSKLIYVTVSILSDGYLSRNESVVLHLHLWVEHTEILETKGIYHNTNNHHVH